MLIHSSIYSVREEALAELVALLQQRPCEVTYIGKEFKKQKNANERWPTFSTTVGQLSISLGESSATPYLMAVKRIVALDEQPVLESTSRFVGFTRPDVEIHRYLISYIGESCEKGVLYVSSEDEEEAFQSKKEHHGAMKLVRVPFSLRLMLSPRSLAQGEKIPVCSGEISFAGITANRKVYVYFHKGEIEMTIDRNETIQGTQSDARVQVEFVLNDFEMSLEDALSLRPGDNVQIESPQELHGIIRIGGGDWLQGKLTYSEGYVSLHIDKFTNEETFKEGTR